MRYILIFLLPLLLSQCGVSQKKNDSNKMDLYLLIGQSNMAGRGSLDSNELELKDTFVLNKGNEWEQAKEPFHFDKPVAGVGLASGFALEVKKHTDAKIGLIPCAVGGTSIDAWMPNAVDPATKTTPYNQTVERTKIALKSGRLAGILWHQGESDSNNGKYKEYEGKFYSLLNNLSKDLEINIDDIPVIVGELAPFFTSQEEYKEGLYVDSVLHQIADSRDNIYCVSTSGLTDIGDSVHFDTKSLRELGVRYAKAYFDIVDNLNKVR